MVKLLIGAVSAFAGCALGLWVGYEIASRDDPYAWWRVEIGAQNREQYHAAILASHVLFQLERGETDNAKSSLASTLAFYELHFRDYDDSKSSVCGPVIPLIRGIKNYSAALREEMAKEAAKPTSTPIKVSN